MSPAFVETHDACVAIESPEATKSESEAAQREIWVGAESPLYGIGPWRATPTGYADFVFGIPADFNGSPNAKVVAIANKTRSATFDVSVTVAKSGEPALAPPNSLNGQPVSFVQGEVVEIDVSDVFPMGLEAGKDNVARES